MAAPTIHAWSLFTLPRVISPNSFLKLDCEMFGTQLQIILLIFCPYVAAAVGIIIMHDFLIELWINNFGIV